MSRVVFGPWSVLAGVRIENTRFHTAAEQPLFAGPHGKTLSLPEQAGLTVQLERRRVSADAGVTVRARARPGAAGTGPLRSGAHEQPQPERAPGAQTVCDDCGQPAAGFPSRGRPVAVISRSDSTLRGHFPTETASPPAAGNRSTLHSTLSAIFRPSPATSGNVRRALPPLKDCIRNILTNPEKTGFRLLRPACLPIPPPARLKVF